MCILCIYIYIHIHIYDIYNCIIVYQDELRKVDEPGRVVCAIII